MLLTMRQQHRQGPHLPGAESQAALLDGHGQRRSHEAALHVRRDVVHALVQVPVLPFLWDHAVEAILHGSRTSTKFWGHTGAGLSGVHVHIDKHVKRTASTQRH